ncbi:hypothetical protein DL95DRAFT_11451 [Leptodontidium sp. 2 PMI_412]|nr:hypothetical protein DL95DRAFT_11451 [Leptodontidium sp. 2 PMI_412]
MLSTICLWIHFCVCTTALKMGHGTQRDFRGQIRMTPFISDDALTKAQHQLKTRTPRPVSDVRIQHPRYHLGGGEINLCGVSMSQRQKWVVSAAVGGKQTAFLFLLPIYRFEASAF